MTTIEIRIKKCEERIKRLTELEAPRVLIDNELRYLQKLIQEKMKK